VASPFAGESLGGRWGRPVLLGGSGRLRGRRRTPERR